MEALQKSENLRINASKLFHETPLIPFHKKMKETDKKDIEYFEQDADDTLSDHDSMRLDDERDYIGDLAPETDDPSTPSLTFRVLFLGILWNIFLGCTNSIFHFRTQPITIPGSVATLLSYPMAILMARAIPSYVINTFGYQWSLNPGPFSIKEHVLIYIIASSGSGIPYGLDNVITQRFDHFMVIFIHLNEREIKM